MLKSGETIEGQLGGPLEIGRELGSGGQGTVYRGRTRSGEDVAVKWYFPAAQSADLRASISELLKRRPPSKHFLWPRDIVTKGDEFGYVMNIRPEGYSNVPRMLKRTVRVRFSELVLVSLRTVAAFRALQSQGLFYCDISDGNLFFSPKTGEILICDNDNVGSPSAKPRVLGTPRYMAPEIVRGTAPPSPLTDSFSMAILLFLLLCNDHPLQGAAEARIRCWDAPAMKKLFGTSPVFIFDPRDDSNRPVPGIHDNAMIFWGMYPEGLRSIFTRVFTSGLTDPGARPSFSEWASVLSALSDAVVTCSCGKQNFFKDDGSVLRCWKCGLVVDLPRHLMIGGRRKVLLNRGVNLYTHHLTPGATDTGERDNPLAEVTKHPTADLLGLTNLGAAQWYLKTASGEAKIVEPGRSANLNPGTEINFGEVVGRVLA